MSSTDLSPLSRAKDDDGLPIYVRFPRKGEREYYTGLSLSGLYRLVMPCKENNFEPPVKSKVINFRGDKKQRKGSRFINLRSLLRYIEQQPEHLARRTRPNSVTRTRDRKDP
jgi:hypothetical protein